MSTPIKKVIIAGAGGNLGAPTLKEFLNSTLDISVLTREDSGTEFPNGVNVIKTNYTKESLAAALQGQDAVISFLAGSALDGPQSALIDAAAEAGVKRFLPSEYGHNTGSAKVRSLLPAFKSKRAAVERIQGHTNLTWTSVITGLFFDYGLARGTPGIDVKAGKAAIWDDGDVPFSATNLHIIAKTIVKILTDGAAYQDSENKYVYLASHTVTQNELLAVTEGVVGKKFEVTKLEGVKVLEDSKAKLANGDFSGIIGLIRGAAFARIDGEALADYRQLGIFNEKHGITDIQLEQDVQTIIAKI